nr:TetR/AcrR family transcriptional regulator C-terminal domain-containing protein [uncultured Niameybacter sp.]
MSTSFLTQQAIANTFKALMKKHAVNKITVKMITDQCGISRHTFYNHFRDIYDLLEWIYKNEVIEELDQNCNLKNWKNGIELVLNYTYEHRVICANTCRSLGREHLEKFLHKTFQTVLEGVIEDISKEKGVQCSQKQAIASFFAFAITGEFLKWIMDGFVEEIESVKSRIVYMFNGTISHLLD